MEVNVEVTVNGVKIPINNLPPPATSKEPKTGGLMYGWDDKGKEPKTGGLMYGWDDKQSRNNEEQAKSGGYGTWRRTEVGSVPLEAKSGGYGTWRKKLKSGNHEGEPPRKG